MRNKKLLLLLFPFLTALSSCGGYSLEYIVSGNTYNSAVFLDNYYTHWDNELKNARAGVTKELSGSEIITSFEDIANIDDYLLVDNPYLNKVFNYPE